MMQPRTTTLAELARLVEGKWFGNPDTPIHNASPLELAQAGEITFADNPERVKQLDPSHFAAVVLSSGDPPEGVSGILVDEVHAAFSRIVKRFRPPRPAIGVGRHPSATIAPSARIAETAQVDAHAVIGEEVELADGVVVHSGVVVGNGCQIGRDTILFPNATLYDDVIVGQRCLVHSCAVLGAHGFGYREEEGRHKLASQLGWVEIGDDVEIGANSTVDRGAYGPTRIGEGTKIDNLVQIAHNCQIGKHNLICSQVGVAGSSSTGDYVVMGGQAGVRDHVHIGDGAVLGAMAGISNHVPAGKRMLGAPATPERQQKLMMASITKLPLLRKEFRALKKIVDDLRRVITAPEDSSEQEACSPDQAA